MEKSSPKGTLTQGGHPNGLLFCVTQYMENGILQLDLQTLIGALPAVGVVHNDREV